jgi:hypothetical protein
MDTAEELARLEEIEKQVTRARALIQALLSEYLNAARAGPARAIRQIGAQIVTAEDDLKELAQLVRAARS